MRFRIWLAGAILTGLLLLAAAWGVIVAQPVEPGIAPYGAQRLLTNFSLSLVFNPVRRADRLIALTQIRLDDYQQLDGTARELDALLELDSTLRRAAISVSELADADREYMQRALEEVATSIVESLGDFSLPDPLVMAIEDAVRQRALAILEGNLAVARTQVHSSTDTLLDVPVNAPTPVATLQGHPFPLAGAHASVPCADCHRSGSFDRLTASTCVDCHEDEHDGAFGNDCEACHNTRDWDDAERVQSAPEEEDDHVTQVAPAGAESTAEADGQASEGEGGGEGESGGSSDGSGSGEDGGGSEDHGSDDGEEDGEPPETVEPRETDEPDEPEATDEPEHEDEPEEHSGGEPED
jgi:hypothetical protein